MVSGVKAVTIYAKTEDIRAIGALIVTVKYIAAFYQLVHYVISIQVSFTVCLSIGFRVGFTGYAAANINGQCGFVRLIGTIGSQQFGGINNFRHLHTVDALAFKIKGVSAIFVQGEITVATNSGGFTYFIVQAFNGIAVHILQYFAFSTHLRATQHFAGELTGGHLNGFISIRSDVVAATRCLCLGCGINIEHGIGFLATVVYAISNHRHIYRNLCIIDRQRISTICIQGKTADTFYRRCLTCLIGFAVNHIAVNFHFGTALVDSIAQYITVQLGNPFACIDKSGGVVIGNITRITRIQSHTPAFYRDIQGRRHRFVAINNGITSIHTNRIGIGIIDVQ